jgi:hypothetical protein
MKFVRIITMICIILFSVMQSCKKDHGDPPELPPQSAFLADFSDFQENKFTTDKTVVNWTHSVINVAVWNTFITVGLAIPVASYLEAVNNHEAEYQSDNTWLWEYSFYAAGSTFTAKLYGTINDNETVSWEMYISRSGFFEDFLWYTGISQFDRMGGSWTLFKSPSEPRELLLIEWERTTEETGHIKYTNIEPGGAENGGYILYGNDSQSDLDSYYDIFNKGANNLTEIEWKKSDLSGRVKDPGHYGDELWHCWDAAQQDVDCN